MIVLRRHGHEWHDAVDLPHAPDVGAGLFDSLIPRWCANEAMKVCAVRDEVVSTSATGPLPAVNPVEDAHAGMIGG